jgi:hypothetical protein
MTFGLSGSNDRIPRMSSLSTDDIARVERGVRDCQEKVEKCDRASFEAQLCTTRFIERIFNWQR